MELKNGTIGKVVIKKANPIDPAKTTQEEYVGIIINQAPGTVIVLGKPTKQTHFLFVTTNNEKVSFYEKDIVSFKSTRLEMEIRECLKEMYKAYETLNKERELLKKQQEKVRLAEENVVNTQNALRKAQGIMSHSEFINALNKEFGFTNKDWEVDFTPGCCVAYKDNNSTLYFYYEEEVLGKYQGSRSSLVYQEYDKTLFMVDDYEKMEEFIRYKKRYERKFFSKLPVNSLCYVGGGDNLYFKCYQSIEIKDKCLTKKTLDAIIETLKKMM